MILFLIVFKISYLNCKDFKKVKMFSNALNFIIRDYYVKNSIKFDIVVPDINAWKFAENVIQFMSPSIQLSPVRIRLIDGSKMDKIFLTSSSIIFLNTTDFFIDNQHKMKMQDIDYVKVRHFAII